MALSDFQLKKRNGASSIEYALLLTVIMIAILLSQKYLVRGIAGRFKQLGDTFGVGRQYDPATTKTCVWSNVFGQWYSEECAQRYRQLNWPTYYEECFVRCIYINVIINPIGPVQCGVTTRTGCVFGTVECCSSSCTSACHEDFDREEPLRCGGSTNCPA